MFFVLIPKGALVYPSNFCSFRIEINAFKKGEENISGCRQGLSGQTATIRANP